jgi:hypothetical protein
MKIFAYCNFVNPLQIPPSQEVRLMNLWRESWSNLGFEPIVLNEYYARQHSYYPEYDRLVSAFPSVNPAKYDRACFIRWLAAANAPVKTGELFLISDYDVMGYEAEPFLRYGSRVTRARPPMTKLVFYEKYCPSLVLGHRATFAAQAQRFALYKLEADDLHDTTPHISDQNILAKMQTRQPTHYEVLHLVRSYGETGWDAAPAVHFCNSAMGPPKAQFQPRHQFIRQLRSF